MVKDLLILTVLTGLTLISFIYYILNVYYSTNYKQVKNSNNINLNNTMILIPVYKEDVETFENVIRAVKYQGVRFIVVGDGIDSNEPYRSITEKYGGKFILKDHGGKRKALAEGMKYVDTDYVMFVDSDTVIPTNAMKDMLTNFKDNVAGVGVNIKMKNDNTVISYASEFIERTKEVIFRAMSYHGSIIVVDGRCALYRTDVVKNYILSPAFKDKQVLGKTTISGDDRDLTGYLIKNGYRVVEDYNISVETDAQKDLKKFMHQQIRWARNGWYYFFKNMLNGTSKKAGWFYNFDMLYMYVMPFLGFSFLLFRLFLILNHFSHFDGASFTELEHYLIFNILPMGDNLPRLGSSIHSLGKFLLFVFMDRLATYLMGIVGNSIFILTIMIKVRKQRLKTLGYGALGLLIMFIANIYGFFTFWKQSKWMSR